MAPSAAPDRSYHALGRRAQIERLRRLARSALAHYGLEDARLALLRHEHNTTFRVDGEGGPFVLRNNRPGVHRPATIGSEIAWLRAIRADAGLAVPEPVAARDGSLAVLARVPGVPGPRVCVLLRRMEGRFVDDGLTPRHLRAVAALQVALQEHAARWTQPEGFVRPRVDSLTSVAKAEGIAPRVAPSWDGDHPSREDADRSLQLVQELFSVGEAAILAAALDVVWTTTRALAAVLGAAGLIHGDLHQENYRFDGWDVRARSTSTTAAGGSTSTTSRSRCPSSKAAPARPSCAPRCSRNTRPGGRCPTAPNAIWRRSPCCAAPSC
jgi:Ser/Thr protein kinase RdoA (MazF antagonist)